MVNKHRGEISATLDGKSWTLCLTLGALAELEASFDADNIVELTERFGTGRLKALDMVRIIGAGLRGAGYTLTNEEVQEMQVDGGATGYVKIVSELLSITFGNQE